MKPSSIQKLVNATLLLAPIVGAFVAAAAVRAAEPGPTVTISALDTNATEAGHAAVFIAIREGGSITRALTVPIKLGGSATPGADYANPGASITFPAQTPMMLVKITPVADALVEGTETVTLTLLATPGSYTLGSEKSATATITDASGSAASTAGSGGNTGPIDPPPGGTTRPPPPTPTGMLIVEITLDGAGNWTSPYHDGVYSVMKFHRTMKYTVPLQGFVGGGSGFMNIDRREQKSRPMLPNLYRYVVLQPQNVMTRAFGVPCGRGDVEILDVYKGMEVGDPGQPPLVSYTETWKGGGPFPSGDKTVPERDLCMTRFALDTDKRVVHILIDGSDSDVKTQITHNSFQGLPVNASFQGDTLDSSPKEKLSFFDVPVPAGAKSFDFARTIANFSQVTGKGNSRVPLTATVKWRVTMQ